MSDYLSKAIMNCSMVQLEVNSFLREFNMPYRSKTPTAWDGNCWFDAVARQLNRPSINVALPSHLKRDWTHEELRHAVFNFMKNDVGLQANDTFQAWRHCMNLMAEEDYEAYLKKNVGANHAWAEETTTSVTALYIGRDIMITSPETAKNSPHNPWYPISGTSSADHSCIKVPPITIAYLKNRHYESIEYVGLSEENVSTPPNKTSLKTDAVPYSFSEGQGISGTKKSIPSPCPQNSETEPTSILKGGMRMGKERASTFNLQRSSIYAGSPPKAQRSHERVSKNQEQFLPVSAGKSGMQKGRQKSVISQQVEVGGSKVCCPVCDWKGKFLRHHLRIKPDCRNKVNTTLLMSDAQEQHKLKKKSRRAEQYSKNKVQEKLRRKERYASNRERD